MSRPSRPSWRRLAAAQSGVLTRAQLSACGIDRWGVAHRVRTERWQQVASNVVATSTGELSLEQRRWVAVLHGGERALLAGVGAAESAGLRNWSRPDIEVLIPEAAMTPSPLAGVRYRRTRRDLTIMRDRRSDLPRCQIEPALLIFAAGDRSERTAAGVLAAAVQQRLTSAERLEHWLDRLSPLRRSRYLRTTIGDIAGGMQSVAEMDVKRMCNRSGIAHPGRQRRRRDPNGRYRFTDCEWMLADRRTLVLEVDGAFHMEVEHWEEDLARQRALTATDRMILRCTARELRDTPEAVARDLIMLGVPRKSCEKE